MKLVSEEEITDSKIGPLVLVEWEDSARPIPAWLWLADDHDLGRIVKCRSVGWLVHDDEHVKALAPNLGDVDDEDSRQASGVIRIPTRCVTRLVRLAESG